MEGDGPTGFFIIFQYSEVISFLIDIKRTTPHQGLRDIIGAMIRKLCDYQTEALHCDPIVMATMLNPRLWLKYFKNKYSDYAVCAEELFRLNFSQYEENVPKPASEANPDTTQPLDILNETSVLNATTTQTVTSDKELDQYLLGMCPCERDTDILKLWCVRVISFFLHF